MKTFVYSIIIILTAVLGLSGCSDDHDYTGNVPSSIQEFVSEYFPEQSISEYSTDGSVYRVKLHNSAAISFDGSYKWMSVNGYGNTLPEMFLFDQLPPALYSYIQEMQAVDGVYSVTRDNTSYTVSLIDSTVTYDIATGIVH